MNIRHNPYILLSVIFLCFSLSNHLSFGIDTISGNQSLSGDQTIVSSGGNFELGFFKQHKTVNYYIAIWYKKVSVQTIVWVANREAQVYDKYGAELRILNGNLVLLTGYGAGILVWSTGMNSSTSNSVVATLRDDGNLVLEDESSSTQPIWQSFDYPTNTFLPGSKIGFNKHTNKNQYLTSWITSEDPSPGLFSFELDPNGSQYRIQWNSSEFYWTSGIWNGETFSLVPEMRSNSIYNYSYVSNENESYFTYSLYNTSLISRLIMDVSGQIKQLTWLDNSGEWNLSWSQPRHLCEVYAYCGAFSTCNRNVQPFCNCLPGFVPKWGNDWNLSDFSGGCVRNTSLQCEGDRFWEKSYMGLPQADENLSVGSSVQCESICLDRCNCTAYANGTSGCSIWYGELLSVKELSENDGTGVTVYIRLAASEFSDDPRPNNNNTNNNNTATSSNSNMAVVIGSVIGSIVVLVAVTGLVIFRRWKNKQGGIPDQFSIF